MQTYVALLRGINSGMNPAQKMDHLRRIFENIGFKNVRTVIASGNVIFDAPTKSRTALEKKIEKALKKGTGVESSTMIRTTSEIRKLMNQKPFKGLKVSQKKRPMASFTKKMVKHKAGVPKKGQGYEVFGVYDGVVCFVVDLTKSRTPDVMLALEKELGKGITTRSWNTVEKVAKLMDV
jgi:uncharacterized protein (DUF1697 family)